uniref:Uncharacterized protein n=1 Tax=Anguilla anguilla TaxID=7936 RepID=A0A0E9T7Z4_ANGAN
MFQLAIQTQTFRSAKASHFFYHFIKINHLQIKFGIHTGITGVFSFQVINATCTKPQHAIGLH